ncbi:hypothetical protein RRG08_036764 [Elysia crispata]|uniref:Uncharacterized protein n=1 Tax=Elysia crispata TaxID=231223 RepID=A0AAE1CUQ8_9GAST|nr:hypothetical protein RRG08_036764 [Elysia crispata]
MAFCELYGEEDSNITDAPKVEPYPISMAFCELYGEEDSNITDAPKVEPYAISMAFCELYGEEDSNITDAPRRLQILFSGRSTSVTLNQSLLKITD